MKSKRYLPLWNYRTVLRLHYRASWSGGMCQRAALAIAVAPNPKLVIADEPETGLDPILRRSVIELLIRVTKISFGLLLISHHEDSVERIADDVVRLRPLGGEL